MGLYRHDEPLPDDLVAPVLVAAFDGWVDAAPGCARLVTFVTPRELG